MGDYNQVFFRAALTGSAHNPAYPVERRLEMALLALELWEQAYAQSGDPPVLPDPPVRFPQ